LPWVDRLLYDALPPDCPREPASEDNRELSSAEHRMMLLIAEGLSTAAIAAQLGRSLNTVRNQTGAVYKQLGVRTRLLLLRGASNSASFPGTRSPRDPGG
jgi:DNA-binding CsgD family transcriptional regulator